MFSLFALKVGAAQLLNERTWHTWDRLRTSPAGFGEILAGKSLPILVAIAAQQAILFGFAAAAFGLQPRAGWWALAACALAWSACVLLPRPRRVHPRPQPGPAQRRRRHLRPAHHRPRRRPRAGTCSARLDARRAPAPARLLGARPAYRAALDRRPAAQLGRPLAMLGVLRAGRRRRRHRNRRPPPRPLGRREPSVRLGGGRRRSAWCRRARCGRRRPGSPPR